MISADNIPVGDESKDLDFTVAAYRDLLRIAKKNYQFVFFGDFEWGGRFLLWRHDCDYSLNRAYALAKIEAAEGICATYFLNPHSAFYNLLEKSQYHIVREILGMGHQIGLHLDAEFHGAQDEDSLDVQVRNEADLLECLFCVRPKAFSFHNPLAFHLSCEQESYGGLINCYSRRFKTEVPYCSDSNGYWRFRRLYDVLSSGKDHCLQVLTHPGWWQESPMPPRQRIFRSVYGRAKAVMAENDAALIAHGRENLSGDASTLAFLRNLLPERYTLLDFLWMSGEMATLFIELWQLHESQFIKLSKAVLCKEWGVPTREVNAFFESAALAVEGFRLFAGVLGPVAEGALGIGTEAYAEWSSLRTQLIRGRAAASKQHLEEGCIFLARAMASLADWGGSQPICYDGFADLETIGLLTCRTVNETVNRCLEEIANETTHTQAKRWEQFISEMESIRAGRGVA